MKKSNLNGFSPQAVLAFDFRFKVSSSYYIIGKNQSSRISIRYAYRMPRYEKRISEMSGSTHNIIVSGGIELEFTTFPMPDIHLGESEHQELSHACRSAICPASNQFSVKNKQQRMKTKTTEFIRKPQETHWVGDGFKVHNFIPSSPGLDMKRMDPFILLDYNAPMTVPPSEMPMGVGVHPHRGFETVTIAYKGKVEHHDSSGGGGVIGTGDVQWMTAAAGVLHKEYHEREWSKQGGEFQMMQLWINLPAEDKMAPPGYQAISSEKMGRYALPEDGGWVEVIAGQYKGVKGPAHTHSPVFLMNARLNSGGKADFAFPPHYNTALLVVEGSVSVNGETAPRDNFVKFRNEGEVFTVEAADGSAVALIMSGQPLNEPIIAYGPFVMNTRAEIRQAFEDYNNGKFGYLEE